MQRIKEELAKILKGEHRTQLLAQYDQLEQKLGGIGASQKTAQLIVADLK
jgi:lipid-A-disaccharide synthase